MEHENYYKFIGKIALEFRLSLDNICKITGKENTEENRLSFYNTLEKINGKDLDLMDKYKYLFFYETLYEKESISKIAYTKAVNYIKRYKQANKEKDVEKIKKLMYELNKTEIDFNLTKDKFGKEILTLEDIEVISKYRIKNLISRERLCEDYGYSRSTLEKREFQLKDDVISAKLKILGEFLSTPGKKMRKNR